MQENTNSESFEKNVSRPKALAQEKGYFHSCTVRLDPEQVFTLCQDESNLNKVIQSLPEFVSNRIQMDQIQKDIDEQNMKITWSNQKHSQIHFKADLFLSPAPADRGTYLVAEAFFEVPRSKILTDILEVEDPEPSMLVGMFLRRLKALFETGEIATTQGQPNGNDEVVPENTRLH